MREAEALKAAGRVDEAVSRYRQAIAANPRSGAAEHNLAACLGDAGRWAEAEPHIRAAFAKGIDAPETWLVLGRCQQSLGRLEAGEAAFRQAIRRRPDMADAQRELAQLLWMRSGDASTALKDIDAALKAAPNNGALGFVKAQALEFMGRVDEAYGLMLRMAEAHPQVGSVLVYASQLAVQLGRTDAGLQFAERAQRVAPGELPVLVTLAEALITAGQAQRASDVAGDIRRKWSTNQHGIALQATAWRMLGDARYRKLYDYGSLVGSALLDVPDGWASREAYVADVSAALNALHAFKEHPFNQSLRHGSQAVDILQQTHAALRALPQALDGPIKRRLQELGPGDDPVRARNRGTYAFQGMWSVKLRPGGYHIDHVHPAGWLSSACYIETVPPKGREGWIRFGQPGLKMQPPLEAEHYVEPKPGMLVLFPSYMWHGTVPFTGDKPRLTFAFDLVPGPVALPDHD